MVHMFHTFRPFQKRTAPVINIPTHTDIHIYIYVYIYIYIYIYIYVHICVCVCACIITANILCFIRAGDTQTTASSKLVGVAGLATAATGVFVAAAGDRVSGDSGYLGASLPRSIGWHADRGSRLHRHNWVPTTASTPLCTTAAFASRSSCTASTSRSSAPLRSLSLLRIELLLQLTRQHPRIWGADVDGHL